MSILKENLVMFILLFVFTYLRAHELGFVMKIINDAQKSSVQSFTMTPDNQEGKVFRYTASLLALRFNVIPNSLLKLTYNYQQL